VLLSTLFEFGVEAMFEEPSIQDLVVTPVFGSLLGVYFMRLRETVKQRNAGVTNVSTGDKVLMFATDPLGVRGCFTYILSLWRKYNIREWSPSHRTLACGLLCSSSAGGCGCSAINS